MLTPPAPPPRTVAYIRKGMAESTLAVQDSMCRRMEQGVLSAPTSAYAFSVIIDHCKWDEATQKVSRATSLASAPTTTSTASATAPDGTTLTWQQQPRQRNKRGTPHVKDQLKLTGVKKHRLKRVLRNTRGAAACLSVQLRSVSFLRGRKKLVLPILCAPQMLTTKGSASLYTALKNNRAFAIEWMTRHSRLVCCVRESDAAAENTRALDLEWAELKRMPRVLQKRIKCFQHQYHMSAGAALAVGPGPKTLASFFNASHALRTYWPDLCTQLRTVIASMLVVRRAVPEPELRVQHETLLRAFGLDVQSDYWACVFCSLFTGDWSNTAVIEHHSTIPLTPAETRDLANRMCDAMLAVVFNTCPEIPLSSRWMRISSTLNWWSKGFLVHNVLTKVLQATLDPSTSGVLPAHIAAEVTSAASASAMVAVDADLLEFTDSAKAWSRAQGVRVRKLLAFINEPGTLCMTLMVSQAAELLAIPQRLSMQANRVRHAGLVDAARPVPILDELHPPTSVVLKCLQCLGYLLSTPLKRAFPLLCGRSPDSSSIWATFRMVARGAASLHLRFQVRLHSWDFRCLSICDSRLPVDARIALACAFNAASPCCLSEHDSLVLRACIRVDAAVSGASFWEAALSPQWQDRLSVLSDSCELNTADVENMHALHKRVENCSHELLSATSVLRQAKAISTSIISATATATTPTTPEPTAAAVQRTFLKWSALHYYHWERCKETGTLMCDKTAWAETRAHWDTLGPEQQRVYTTVASIPQNTTVLSALLRPVFDAAGLSEPPNTIVTTTTATGTSPPHPFSDPPTPSYVGLVVSGEAMAQNCGSGGSIETYLQSQPVSMKAAAQKFATRRGVAAGLDADAVLPAHRPGHSLCV